jgi:hypothetical protein
VEGKVELPEVAAPFLAGYQEFFVEVLSVQFEGTKLLDLIATTATPIEILDETGNLRGSLDQKTAAWLARNGRYVGVGNIRRIRHLRPLGSVVDPRRLSAASRMTRRIRNDAGVIISAPWIREHGGVVMKPEVKATKG